MSNQQKLSEMTKAENLDKKSLLLVAKPSQTSPTGYETVSTTMEGLATSMSNEGLINATVGSEDVGQSGSIDINNVPLYTKDTYEELGNKTVFSAFTEKQDKLIAGQNIVISPDGKTISATGGGGGSGSSVVLVDNTEGGVDLTVDSTTRTLAKEDEVSGIKADLSELDSRLSESITEINDEGFYVVDENNNIGIKYTPQDGLDFAKISEHAKKLLSDTNKKGNYYYFGERFNPHEEDQNSFDVENFCKLQSNAQACAIYGDYIFQGIAGGQCKIYSVANVINPTQTMTPIASVDLEPITTNTSYHHNNSLLFMEGVKYDEGDEFPLLLSQASDSLAGSKTQPYICAYVYRIQHQDGAFIATKISDVYYDQRTFEGEGIDTTNTAVVVTYSKKYNKLLAVTNKYTSTATATIAINRKIFTLFDMPDFKATATVYLNQPYYQFTSPFTRWKGMQAQICIGDSHINAYGQGTNEYPNALEIMSIKRTRLSAVIFLNGTLPSELEGIMYSDKYGFLISDINGNVQKIIFK